MSFVRMKRRKNKDNVSGLGYFKKRIISLIFKLLSRFVGVRQKRDIVSTFIKENLLVTFLKRVCEGEGIFFI